MFVPLHHVRKGTRLSPSLSFIVVVRGESLGTRLYYVQLASQLDMVSVKTDSWAIKATDGVSIFASLKPSPCPKLSVGLKQLSL